MFTTIAFSASLDAAGVFANIAGVVDQHIKVEGDSIYVNEFNRLIGAMACLGNTVPGECRIVSPSIRRLSPYYIHPVIDQIYPTTYVGVDMFPKCPVLLDIDEQLEVEADSNPAAAEQHTVIMWLANQEIVPAKGTVFTVKATTTVALVAGSWEYAALSFADDLPVGSYDVVGMHVGCDEGVAARLVPVGSINRPGVPCVSLQLYQEFTRIFRKGNLGVFCSFPHNNKPGIEILGSAAEASDTYDVYLDLIKK